MNAKYIIFYLIAGTPAYFLLYFGFKGLGWLPSGYYGVQMYNAYPGATSFDVYSFILNFVPTPGLTPFFFVAAGIIFAMLGGRAIMKYTESEFRIIDIFDVRSDVHLHHCEITAFSVYFGTALLIVAVVIAIFFSMQFGSNLVMLFGLATASGVGALMWYRHEHEKWPFGG